MSGMMFRPSLHGWPFANAFPDGTSQLEIGGPLAETFGLCGGMCWAALDRFLADRGIDRGIDRPQPGEPLHAELVRRQLDVLSAGVWRRALDWQNRPDHGRPLRRAGVAELTRKEWPRLRRKLDAGEPVLLCVLRAESPFSSPSENPQLLAYRYAHDRKRGQLTLWIYDPSRPDDDELRLKLRLGRRGRRLDAMLGGAERVRGFFTIPYDRTRPPALVAEIFSDRSRVTLDRPILGRPAPVLGAGGRIHVFGRDAEGNLVHFHRRPGPYWEYESPTEHRKLGGEQRIHGDPVAVRGPGRGLAVFARNYVGDLIHYRESPGRGWSAANLTDTRRIGVEFRIEGKPAVLVGPGRRLDVLARNREGRLIHYEWIPMRGWSATDLMERRGGGASGELRGDPVGVVGPDRTQHVFGRNQDGDVIHWQRAAGGDWAAERVPVRREDGERLRMAGDPVVAGAGPVGLDVFCRGEAGELAHLHRSHGTGWSARPLAPARDANGTGSRVQSSPVIAAGPGGMLHVFARSSDGDLLHWHRPSPGAGWSAENVTASRPAIGGAFRFESPPVPVAGPAITLHVFVRSGGDLLLYGWRPDAGWTAERFAAERRAIGERYRLTGEPVPLTDAGGLPHIFGTDGAGTLVHIETPPKRRRRVTGARKARSAPQTRRRAAADGGRTPARTAVATAAAAARPNERDPGEPVPDLPLLDPVAVQAEGLAGPAVKEPAARVETLAGPAEEPAAPVGLPSPEGFAIGSELDWSGRAREPADANGAAAEPLAVDAPMDDAPVELEPPAGLPSLDPRVAEPAAEPEPPLPELPGWMTEATPAGPPPAGDDPVEVQLLDLSELLPTEDAEPAESPGNPRPPRDPAPTGPPAEKKREPPPGLPAWLQLDGDRKESG